MLTKLMAKHIGITISTELSQVKVHLLFIIIAHLSSWKKDEPERNVGVLSSKARTQVFSITQ